MPYIKKTNYRKKYNRRRYKKRSYLSKRQQNMIKALAVKTVEKTRELKNLSITVDEDQRPLISSGAITNNFGINNIIFNVMNEGTSINERVGNQIQPVRFHLRGWAKINGYSESSAYQEIKCRLVVGFMKDEQIQEMAASQSTVPFFWNGVEQIAQNNYKDILRNMNYDIISPIYDRTFTVAPAPYNTFDGSTATSGTTFTRCKDYFNFNINHKFGKSRELMWNSRDNDCFQKGNLVMLCFTRTLNDDTVITTNVLEFNAESNFYYHDA